MAVEPPAKRLCTGPIDAAQQLLQLLHPAESQPLEVSAAMAPLDCNGRRSSSARPPSVGTSANSNVLPFSTPRMEDCLSLLDDVVGTGHFGTVTPAVDKTTGAVYACKRILKSRLITDEEREELRREVAVMQRLGAAGGHPHVVQLRGLYEDEASVRLVMDFCEEGELYQEVTRRGSMAESDAARCFAEIASGVAFCHSSGVLHRDLKPENILLTCPSSSSSSTSALRRLSSSPSSSTPSYTAGEPARTSSDAAGMPGASSCAAPSRRVSRVKLADFGLALILGPSERARGAAGSALYMAPEVHHHEYDFKADVWSLGIILYILLCGRHPFPSLVAAHVSREGGGGLAHPNQAAKGIPSPPHTSADLPLAADGAPEVAGGPWDSLPSYVQSFVRSMLKRNPDARPSAHMVLKHPWLRMHTLGGRIVRRVLIPVQPASQQQRQELQQQQQQQPPLSTSLQTHRQDQMQQRQGEQVCSLTQEQRLQLQTPPQSPLRRPIALPTDASAGSLRTPPRMRPLPTSAGLTPATPVPSGVLGTLAEQWSNCPWSPSGPSCFSTPPRSPPFPVASPSPLFLSTPPPPRFADVDTASPGLNGLALPPAALPISPLGPVAVVSPPALRQANCTTALSHFTSSESHLARQSSQAPSLKRRASAGPSLLSRSVVRRVQPSCLLPFLNSVQTEVKATPLASVTAVAPTTVAAPGASALSASTGLLASAGSISPLRTTSSEEMLATPPPPSIVPLSPLLTSSGKDSALAVHMGEEVERPMVTAEAEARQGRLWQAFKAASAQLMVIGSEGESST